MLFQNLIHILLWNRVNSVFYYGYRGFGDRPISASFSNFSRLTWVFIIKYRPICIGQGLETLTTFAMSYWIRISINAFERETLTISWSQENHKVHYVHRPKSLSTHKGNSIFTISGSMRWIIPKGIMIFNFFFYFLPIVSFFQFFVSQLLTSLSPPRHLSTMIYISKTICYSYTIGIYHQWSKSDIEILLYIKKCVENDRKS